MKTPRKKKAVKVIRRKLRRERAYGQAFTETKVVEIEERRKRKSSLRDLVHELLHVAFPEKSERQIIKAERLIGDSLWDENYRKVDQ